jgi:ABC-2 type transport system permease protein
MGKTLIVAQREFWAAVRTKAFLIGLVLMPVMMGGSILVQLLLKDVGETKDKKIGVLDRTPADQSLSAALQRDLAAYNTIAGDDSTGKRARSRYLLEVEPLTGTSPEEVDQARAALMARMRKGELSGFLEIGPDVYKPLTPTELTAAPDALSRHSVEFYTNRVAALEFRQLLNRLINEEVQKERARSVGVTEEQRQIVTSPVQVIPKVEATFVVPLALTMLMFLVLMMVANPLLQGVVEEKMQRIAEVLLGSVTPFQLMLGKLLGMAAVSLTIVTVYLSGAIWAAYHFEFGQFVPSVDLLVWFFAFQILAALMYGSLFIAIGAACTDMRETQSLLLPVMLICCIPLFLMGSVLQEPNSPMVTGVSFFPLATPMLMIARQSVPPGLPLWQPLVGMLIVLLTTLVCVWAAGRIFRVGLLMQGKGAHFGEMLRWVVRG